MNRRLALMRSLAAGDHFAPRTTIAGPSVLSSTRLGDVPCATLMHASKRAAEHTEPIAKDCG